ncbi:hypothetical protein CRYUN_Cryun13aG0128300 [Craigia yunnanensis]
MHEKDHFAFNAMISCYAQNSQPKEAIKLFDEMLKVGVTIQPDGITLASVISARSQLGELRFGSWIESYINKLGIQMDDHMSTDLINFYAKCGHIVDKACNLFHGLRKKDVVAYIAMVLGCAINGEDVDVITLFQKPVDINGLYDLVEKGYQCFNSMKDNGVVPSTDQYAIMVDLLGSAGRLEDAYEFIKSMPMKLSIALSWSLV